MPEDKQPDPLFFNGIDGATGAYALPSMTGEQLFDLIKGEEKPENINELRFRHREKTVTHLGVREGVDPTRLEQTGWGVIFAHDADPAVKEALSELLRLRERQAGEHFKVYDGANGYLPDETKTRFLARHGAGPGPADPVNVPYYLLLVGSPEAIPYRFQTQLDVQYAVGRLHFNSPDAYANYARSVVQAETGGLRLPRRLTCFGVANADDRATQLSAAQLVGPVAEALRAGADGWAVESIVGAGASKARLGEILGGDAAPALLFTASHGLGFPNGDPRQIPHQGALLCGDWPGPEAWRGKPIPQDFYFAGDDLTAEANLLGLVAFFFACYGAGTPRMDEFSQQAFKQPTPIAPHAFLARLPVEMLSRPRGGALAVIGHVERAWGYSFAWPGAGSQTAVFEDTLKRLLAGHPVGSAIEYFNERYAELATVLSDELELINAGMVTDPYQIAGLWTANNDARGYAILGDPAVRLPVAAPDEEADAARPALAVQPAATPPGAAGPAPATPAAEVEEEPDPEPAAAAAGQETPRAIQPVERPPLQVEEPLIPFLPQVDTFLWVSQARDAFGVSGKGLAVAVLDTGLNTAHVDFAGRVVAQRNFTPDNGGDADDASDGNGHGTNVAGIIVANGTHRGVAPDANVIPLKVLRDNGGGDFAWVTEALGWVLDNREAFNISAVCMSLGDGGNYSTDIFFNDTMRARIKALREARVAVCIAAGNDYFTHKSQQGMAYPGIIRECISIGAVYDAEEGGFSYSSGAKANSSRAGQITPFSQRLHPSKRSKTYTDIFAPGAPITSSGIRGPRGESTQHGTSQATPVIAGLVLLMQEFYLRLTGELPEVEDLVVWLRRGGVEIFDGDDENDNVEHTNLRYVRADALSALDTVRRALQKRMLEQGLNNPS